MPGNEVADKVHNFFEQDNLSQGQHQSQVPGGNWPLPNSNLWVGSQRQVGTQLASNLKTYGVQQSDTERGSGTPPRIPLGSNLTQLTSRTEFAKNQLRNQQQGNAVMNRDSGRLEAAEASRNFHGGQPLMRGQQVGGSQPQSRQQQQPGLNDLPVWQQNLMLSRLQELQRQRQIQLLQQQQNPMNIPPALARQLAEQLPSVVNGMPVHDGSNFFWPGEHMGGEPKVPNTSQAVMAGNMNWSQHAGSPSMHGSTNGPMFSHYHGQVARSSGLVQQQFDQSLYGAPVANTRGAFNQIRNQGTSHDYDDASNKARGNQGSKPVVQSPAFNNSFHGIQSTIFQDDVSTPDNHFTSKQEFRGRLDPSGWPGNLQEKVISQVGPSQDSVSLDPTEKKILFNEDENWESPFGGGVGNTGAGGFGNAMESSEFAFSSMQSGSWSALMQSAVAETSSSDTGVQDEWSGLSYQQTDQSTGNQPGTFSESGKERASWVDNNTHKTSSLTSRSFPLFDDANMGPNSSSIPGFQQPGIKSSFQQGQAVQNNVPHEFIQETPMGGQWLNQNIQKKSQVEGISQVQSSTVVDNAPEGAWNGHSYEQSESSAHSAETELNAHAMQGSWVHRKSMSSYNTSGTPSNNQNGWNVNDTMSQRGNVASTSSDNLSNIQLSQGSDQKRGMQTLKGHDNGIWKVSDSHMENSFPSSSGVPNPTIARGNQEINRHIQNRHQTDRVETVENFQHHFDNGPRVFESSMNNSDNGTTENFNGKQENFYQKESSNDSQKSNQSHHTVLSGSLRKNVLTGSDSHALTSGNQMFEAKLGRPAHGPRDFQHHPVGNLDMDPTDSRDHVIHPDNQSQQVIPGSKSHELGHFGQSKFVGHLRDKAIDMGKGHSSEIHGNPDGPMEMPPRGTRPGYGSRITGSFDGKSGLVTSSPKALQSSDFGHGNQNMLELIHKVDQSREQSVVRHLGSSGAHPSSEMPESEASHGSITQHQVNHPSSMQGFGLRLGPPSQRVPASNHVFSPQNPSKAVNDLNSRYVESDVGETRVMPTSHPSHEISEGVNQDNKLSGAGQSGSQTWNTHAKSSEATSSNNELQRQHMSGASGQVMNNHTFARHSSFIQPHNSHDAPLADQSTHASLPGATSKISPSNHDPALQPTLMPGMSHQGTSSVLPNVWNNVPTQHHPASIRPHKVPLQSIHSSNNNPASTLATHNSQEIAKRENVPSDYGICSVNSQQSFGEERFEKESSWRQPPSERTGLVSQISGASQEPQVMAARAHQQEADREKYGKDSSMVAHTDHASQQTTAACSRDIEAFGRSLRPSQNLHQSYSLLQQVQAVKGVENDSIMNDAKRFKGANYGTDMQRIVSRSGQQLFYGQNSVARDGVDNDPKEAGQHSSYPSDGNKPLTFSSEAREVQVRPASSEPGHGDIPSQVGLTMGQMNHRIHSGHPSLTSGGSESRHVSPQMAATWFEQYGAFKNGQLLQMHAAQGTLKNIAQNSVFGKASERLHEDALTNQIHADANQFGGETAPTSLLGGDIVSRSSPPDNGDKGLAVVEPKKRKSASLELLPWHKEVAHGSQRLQNLSAAEEVWAQATNRLVEKLEDETEMGEDGQLLLRSRRRLILTTQLMQQLLRPPPLAILSSDATSNYESVTYTAAKLALGDTCSLISSYSGNDSDVAPENGNTTPTRTKITNRACDLHFSEVVENFISRAKKLESDLYRLDNRASILDLRLECQDLERFSVINRFAKFHGRGNVDVGDASGSAILKTAPQRYVTASAMPRNVPEGVQCLSL